MGQERDEKSGKFKSKGKRKVKKEVEEKTVDLENENEEEIVPEIGFQILVDWRLELCIWLNEIQTYYILFKINYYNLCYLLVVIFQYLDIHIFR